MGTDDLAYKDEVYQIVGAAIEVHKELGKGFLEAVYQEALELELGWRGIPYAPQAPIRVFYKGHELEQRYFADFLCFEEIIVEIKAVKCLNDEHLAQALNYLHGCRKGLGLLINFGSQGRLEWKRVVLSENIDR